MLNRVIWIILDSAGIGELPDADKFGDEGADTFGHIYESKEGFGLPNLEKLGIGNIQGVNKNIRNVVNPVGIYGKAMEKSKGKDTTVGHWEMTGIITETPFKVYPNGFNEKIINKFIESSNLPGILCNKVGSGTKVIEEYGVEHIKTKKPIVYTSADSVFQVACHTSVYSLDELYEMCENARKILCGDDSVARVIARPFDGNPGNFVRTSDRRDFSVKPSDSNLLKILQNNGISVTAVGKINDIFCGSGIEKAIHTTDNMDGVNKTLDEMKELEKGLIFTNLVEFDSKWGHRRNVEGYGQGLVDFDSRLPQIIDNLRNNDLLIINADHGCDPTFKGTDHTREYIPVIAYSKNCKNGVDLGILNSFSDIGATIAEIFGVKISNGESFLNKIL